MTSDGLWCESGGNWSLLAYHGKKVYDLLITPQFLFLGCSDGIGFYDLFTADWCKVPLRWAVTSLAVFHQYLVGTTIDGKLVMGNKRGGFSAVTFEGMHMFKVVAHQSDVFVCTSRGIYRLSYLGGRLVLQSLGVHCPVTDMVVHDHTMFVSTMHHSIWYKSIQRRIRELEWTMM